MVNDGNVNGGNVDGGSMNTPRQRRRPRKWMSALLLIVCGGALAVLALKPRRPENAPGPSVTRRLTADQYRNIIADVFGEDIDLGGRLEPDLRDGRPACGRCESGQHCARGHGTV